MNKKKYILVDNYVPNDDPTKLYRIKAVKSFGNIKEGDFGGSVKSEDNLSQEGNCWIYCGGIVEDNTVRVEEDAQIYDGNLKGNTIVKGKAQVDIDGCLNDATYMTDNARIIGKVSINGYTTLSHNALIYGHVSTYGSIIMTNNATIIGNVICKGDITLRGSVIIEGLNKDTNPHKNKHKPLTLDGEIILSDGKIRSNTDWLSIGPSNKTYTNTFDNTYITLNKQSKTINYGKFSSSLTELLKQDDFLDLSNISLTKSHLKLIKEIATDYFNS